MNSDIDKIFKSGLSDYSQKPPVFIWDAIEHTMNRKRVKRRRNIIYSIAASVALILSFSAGYLFTDVQFIGEPIAKLNEPNYNTVLEPLNSTNQKPIAKPGANVNKNSDPASVTVTATEKNQENDVAKETIELEKSADNNKVLNKESNVKKASSMGMLLPPGFGSTNQYPNESTFMEQETLVYREENVSRIAAKFAQPSQERDIIYVYRELPIYPDEYEEAISDNSNLWAVGLSATPLVSYRTVGGTSNESMVLATANSTSDNNYSNEKPLTSYSAGVAVNYSVAKRWNIQSGVYFSEIGQVSENSTIYNTIDPSNNGYYYLNTSSGNVKINGSPSELQNNINRSYDMVSFPGVINTNKDAAIGSDIIQTFNYCEFPIVVNYKLIDRRLDMKLSGGLSANVMYQNSIYLQKNDTKYNLDSENQDYKTMSYNGIVGFGFEYPILLNLNVNLNPTFRYALNPITSTNSVHTYSLGIYTGLIYNF
ncbi:MAG: outer membrane beta-barrel protein [Salinivirgaceae bacterium]